MTSRIVPFKQVDVFTSRPYQGNPVAVVLDGDGLTPAAMQRIAAWTNLSETTFVLPPTQPGADYRVRIFTPRQELPFAGHPSVGTAHAVLESGFARQHDHRLTMECAAGLLDIAIEGDGADRKLYVTAPEARFEDAELTLAVALAKALGVTIESDPAPRAVNVGPTWIVVDLVSADRVRALKPDLGQLKALSIDYDATGITVFGRTGDDTPRYVVRSFVPADGIDEDPVCGSGNVAVAAFLRDNDLLEAPNYAASQGREVGRDGIVQIRTYDDGRIEVGGAAVTCIDGAVRLEL